MMGLGSIVGTGVFVSIGIAAGVTGPSVILAVALAAMVATCNGLNSAQLAASHPVSGGSYEYGYKYLAPWLGFVAGWMFLLAKSASAATAALGVSGYLLQAANLPSEELVPIAAIIVVSFILIVLGGIRRSNRANIAIVSLTLLALGFFIVSGLPTAIANSEQHLGSIFPDTAGNFLQASALMFVAYTGYGRIATLGEEAKNPRRTIPTATIVTLGTTMLLYAGVAVVGVGTVGAGALGPPPSRRPIAATAATNARPSSSAPPGGPRGRPRPGGCRPSRQRDRVFVLNLEYSTT